MGDMKSNIQENKKNNQIIQQKNVNVINVPESEPEHINNVPIRQTNDIRSERKKIEGPAKIFGWICLVLSVATFIAYDNAYTSIDESKEAQILLEEQASTVISAGTILAYSDESGTATDYEIVHSSNQDSTTIWVWDYAAEDGDVIRVLVDGQPITKNIMIKHKVVEITVPSTGLVQIEGVHDGGGGITYAVRYDINGTTYINTAPEGECNTYTLRRE